MGLVDSGTDRHGKVIARVKGGLGNQLFCYAAAKRLAVVNQAQLIIDDVSGFSHDVVYKRKCALNHFNIKERSATPRERMEPFGRVRRKLAMYMNLHRAFEHRSYLLQEGLGFESRLLNRKVNGTVYLDGTWQSEDYFKDVSPIIREDFRIAPPTDRENLLAATAIDQAENPVAVHVRWFDSPNSQGSILNLSKRYYLNAMRFVERELDKPNYFVFSDNIEATKALLNFPDNRVTFIMHNNIEDAAFSDLSLMTMCKHFILSNSTLNWWGAWLAQCKGLVTYPDKDCFSILDDQHECLFSSFARDGFVIGDD